MAPKFLYKALIFTILYSLCKPKMLDEQLYQIILKLCFPPTEEVH